MRAFLLICAAILFIGVTNLPIGYYTFLRIAITIGAVTVCISEWRKPSKSWLIAFGAIAILFNPIIPIYLNNKGVWIPIDIICGIIFGIKAFVHKPTEKNPE